MFPYKCTKKVVSHIWQEATECSGFTQISKSMGKLMSFNICHLCGGHGRSKVVGKQLKELNKEDRGAQQVNKCQDPPFMAKLFSDPLRIYSSCSRKTAEKLSREALVKKNRFKQNFARWVVTLFQWPVNMNYWYCYCS